MSYSFDIKNSVDLFNELSKRIDEYHNDPISSGNAVVCAILCWHVVEWIYQEYDEVKKQYSHKKDFKAFVKGQCVSLSYIQDIANGSKHRGITRYIPVVKKTKNHKGDFSNDFSHDFNISCFKIELEENKVIYFNEEINKAKIFIKNYLNETLSENV